MNEDIFSKGIGNREMKSLVAKPCIFLGKSIEDVPGKKGGKNEGKTVGQKLVLHLKHPDKEEPIKISQAKIIVGESVKVVTLWVNLDEDKNIQKGSPIAAVLQKYGIASINGFAEGKSVVETETDKSGFLCVKAY